MSTESPSVERGPAQERGPGGPAREIPPQTPPAPSAEDERRAAQVRQNLQQHATPAAVAHAPQHAGHETSFGTKVGEKAKATGWFVGFVAFLGIRGFWRVLKESAQEESNWLGLGKGKGGHAPAKKADTHSDHGAHGGHGGH